MVVYVEFPLRSGHAPSIDITVAKLDITVGFKGPLKRPDDTNVIETKAQVVAPEEDQEDMICTVCGST